MRLCLRAHAIDWCENSIVHSKRFQKPGEFGQTVFPPSRMRRKNGWFTRLVTDRHTDTHTHKTCTVTLLRMRAEGYVHACS